jgi:hypothetical protein
MKMKNTFPVKIGSDKKERSVYCEMDFTAFGKNNK